MQAFLFGASALLFEASALLSGLGAGAFKAMANLFEAMRNWLEREGNCLELARLCFQAAPGRMERRPLGLGLWQRPVLKGFFCLEQALVYFPACPYCLVQKILCAQRFCIGSKRGPMGDGFGDIHGAARRFRLKQGLFWGAKMK